MSKSDKSKKATRKSLSAGLLVSFEGGEGAGKSTQIELLAKRLKRENYPFIVTREPGGSKLGEKIRKLFKGNEMSALTELFLVEASRADHVQNVIRPALAAKKIVLCDRFQESSLVYQTRKGIDIALVRKLNEIATNGLTSDLIFYLDLPDTEIKKRLTKRQKDKKSDRFDRAELSVHQKIRAAYLELIKSQTKPPIIQISSMFPKKEIHEQIYTQLVSKL